MRKTLLGFDFDGSAKTMWLKAAKRQKLLTVLKGWVRLGRWGTAGIPFKKFELVTAKLCHAFTYIPAGVGLLLPCNHVLKLRPPHMYLHRIVRVLNAIEGCRTLLRESTQKLTRCQELTCGWPDFISIVNASSHGNGGVIFGELSGCTPTVFCLLQNNNNQKSTRHHHKFSYGNGGATTTLVSNGRGVRTPPGKMDHAVQ